MNIAFMKELMRTNSYLGVQPTVNLTSDFALGFADGHFVENAVASNGVPLLLEDNRIIYIIKGGASVMINLIEHRVHAGDIFVLSKGSLAQIMDIDEDTHIMGMAFSSEFFALAMGNHQSTLLADGLPSLVMTLPEDEAQRLLDIGNLISPIIKSAEHKEVVYGLFTAFISTIHKVYKGINLNKDERKSREREIFDQFIALVNEHCKEQHELGFYADKLFITPRYLSTVVAQVSGTTAKQWIDQAVVLQAKVMLRHTDLTVSQIAMQLHFANDSFFCKFFKRLSGVTPAGYRKEE